MDYLPKPIDTESIELDKGLMELAELLAKNAHDIWAQERLSQGWTYGPSRRDDRKEHPCLVPYEELPESEKVYDRRTAMETLKAVCALGYRVSPEPKEEKVSE